MFDTRIDDVPDGDLSRESVETQLAYDLTCRVLADGWVEPDRHVLPSGFEHLPIPFLSAVVTSVDRSKLNGHDVVRLMQAEAMLESAFTGGKMASMVEVAFSPQGDAESPVERCPGAADYAAAEIATALTLTRRSAETQLESAMSLTGSLHRVWERLATGKISMQKAGEFGRALGHLDNPTVDQVLDRTLDAAPGLTTGQLRARLHRLVLEADPSGMEHAMAEGLEDRKVVSHQNPDLTGSIGILSAHPSDVAAAMSHVDMLARSLMTADETRTLDQIRNDVAIDLLRGRHFDSDHERGRVVVTIPASTLEGMSNEPGSLNGFGPVTAEIARKTVMENIEGEWVFAVTDNGHSVATGTLARRPRAGQQRQIRANYPTCVFPGCRIASYQCDLDHRRPFSQGGPTHNDNLAPLCRHHHMMRHHSPWQLERLADGDHQWTSPLGHTYLRLRSPPE